MKAKKVLFFLCVGFLAACGQPPASRTSLFEPRFSDSWTVGERQGSMERGGSSSPRVLSQKPSLQTPLPAGTEPVYQFDIQGVGYPAWQQVKVSAGHVLKARFQPLANDQAVSGTGFVPQYSQLSVTVRVPGKIAYVTSLLDIASGESSGEMHFVNVLDACRGKDADCRQEVVLEVGAPNYDYWWQNYGQCGDGAELGVFCLPYTHVYESHPWSGVLYVQTDDTEPLPDQVCAGSAWSGGEQWCDRPQRQAVSQ